MVYVNDPKSAQQILRSQLKNGNSCLGKLVIETLDSLTMKKMAVESMANEKKPGSTRSLLGL